MNLQKKKKKKWIGHTNKSDSFRKSSQIMLDFRNRPVAFSPNQNLQQNAIPASYSLCKLAHRPLPIRQTWEKIYIYAR